MGGLTGERVVSPVNNGCHNELRFHAIKRAMSQRAARVGSLVKNGCHNELIFHVIKSHVPKSEVEQNVCG